MASELQQATIKIRRDTAANWTSNDPTPLEGEWCMETDTKITKIGDGTTAWSSLDDYIDPKAKCTAWVNFNGTGTVAIRDSYNVSSITDNGTGLYTVNLTTALDNTNFVALLSYSPTAVTTGMTGKILITSTSTIDINNETTAGANTDVENIYVAVFGGKD